MILPETPVAEREALTWNPMLPNGDPGMDLIRSCRNIEALLTAILYHLENSQSQEPVQAIKDEVITEIGVGHDQLVREMAGNPKRPYTKKNAD